MTVGLFRRRGFRLLVLIAVLMAGCTYQTPISQSEDAVELDITPPEMELRGFTQASARRFHILFFGFGSRNSYPAAERAAIEANGSELLVGRTRLRTFEGLLIPGLWLQAFGFQGASDIPIIGWETYTVAGTGVRMVPARNK